MQRLMARERSSERPGDEEQGQFAGPSEWAGIGLYRKPLEMV